jgi:hypothetical protein
VRCRGGHSADDPRPADAHAANLSGGAGRYARHANTDGAHAIAHVCRHAPASADGHPQASRADGDRHAHQHADAHVDPRADANPGTDVDPRANLDPRANVDARANTYAHANADAHANALRPWRGRPL